MIMAHVTKCINDLLILNVNTCHYVPQYVTLHLFIHVYSTCCIPPLT